MNLKQLARRFTNRDEYRSLHWTGSFEEYLDVVRKQPHVTRNAFQRTYDMIMSWGTDEFTRYKRSLTRYKFFSDPIEDGHDAIYGLEEPLMRLVGVLKSAAFGYGTEKRIILLHGPVGSSKSTIARLLKKGLEAYSRTEEGALYTFQWRINKEDDWEDSPMHEDPLKLVPLEFRDQFLRDLLDTGDEASLRYPIEIDGDLDPSSRFNFKMLLDRYDGDWWAVLENHVRVRRLMLSEKDRVGIGTFQPKDEKNQDSTELTGDINYRKIALYGSDSDPRAFNFDGEFNIANRGLIEFIEILKLDVAFLYDLLGATQEHRIKPKKFAQTDIDEVILGHSVAGDTPIPFRIGGTPGWTTLQALEERFAADASGLEVLAYDFERGETRWTPVRRVFKHRFEGEMLTTSQRWGAVETTPNHSIYDRDGHVFYPEDQHEVMAVRRFDDGFSGGEAVTLDVLQGVAGFVREGVKVTSAGTRLTKPPQPGWARLDEPRHATQVRAVYDTIADAEALEDLITVLVWYSTEGHANGRNGGIVISQADRDELERVRGAYARITTGKGSIDAGAKSDSAWRLYLGSGAIAAMASHHCGELSATKRLPDFLFQLPERFLRHALEELIRTDGSRSLGKIGDACTEEYRTQSWEYKTVSPLLAAQVGTLATLLGQDYSVYRGRPAAEGRPAPYRIRFVSSTPKRGGRRKACETRLERRPAGADEWVYDIECEVLHNFVCGVGNVVCHNTNEPEYRKLQSNELMEAFRDRTVKIDIPYITTLDDEIKIYDKDFNNEVTKGKFIAPHTVEMAAMWAVLTRLEEPKAHSLSLMQKLKLYNGKTLPGFTEDNVAELREDASREGMQGISPRYVQDKISNALVSEHGDGTINPFMVLNELEEGLRHHSLLSSEDLKKHYKDLLAVVKEEYEDIVKNEVQKAISADEDAIARLCANYVDNVKAYTQREKVKNKYTGQDEEPDERLMRSIEEKIDIPESRKDDFRREIMNYIGALAIEGKQFHYWTNERLQKALELKLFEDQKDSIKLTNLVADVVDKETQEKIDVVKARLIKNYGYNEVSATDVLNYVASIFARGDAVRSGSS